MTDRAAGNYELEGCSHRISGTVVALPGYSIAEWDGDLSYCCRISQSREGIEIKPVALWLIVDHAWDEEGVMQEFQSVEPWDGEGILMRGTYLAEGNWEQSLVCNTSHWGRSQKGHCEMRIFGPTEQVRQRVARLTEDDCNPVG